MISQLLAKDNHSYKPAKLVPSPFSSDSEDECYREAATSRKSRSHCRFRHAEFLEEGEAVNSFKTVMLVGLHTIQTLIEEGNGPKPQYKHFEFMAKKASMCRYKYEAFVCYDCRVWERASVHGTDAFVGMSSEDAATFFCAENMWYNSSRLIKKGNDGYKKKFNKICISFNETGCSFTSCNYSHVCLACENQGHGHKDCPLP